MRRRALLRAGAAAAAAILLGGHTPYRQWEVYRKKHLLIGCHKEDPRTYQLAKEVVALLDQHLPAARARVARATGPTRLASLMATDQLSLAVLGGAEAEAMRAGAGRFASYGRLDIRLLIPVFDRLLVAVAGFREDHAWQVAQALAGSPLVPRADPAAVHPAPWHPGSHAFLRGAPYPEAAE